MSLTIEMINDFILNNPHNISDLSEGIKYYSADLLEEYDEKEGSDIPFNFTYNYRNKQIYKFDAYFRIYADNDTLLFVYNTKIDDKYYSRCFEDLNSLDELKDIFEEQIYELIAINSGDEEEDDD